MRHLDDTQLVDAVDGRLDAAAAAHADACGTCGARISEMREALRGLAAVEVPEPSPLFWDHFPSRVRRAIDAPAAPRRWFTPARIAWGSAATAVVVLALLLLPQGAPPAGVDPHTSDVARLAERPEPWPPGTDPYAEDLNADEAWALVRSVAEEIDYEDAREIGVTPRAGAIERAAMELSAPERAELARLIEQELKRTGD